jgi:uncharacterized protein (TIGR03435 family)
MHEIRDSRIMMPRPRRQLVYPVLPLLSLKLVEKKLPFDVVVVDAFSKAPTEN